MLFNRRMALTTQDLKQIKNIVEEVVELKLEQKLEEKLEQKLEEKLNDKLRLLPTRDEFLTKMDEVMGELKDTREEQTMLSYRVSVHSDEISALQDIHPNNNHAFAN